MLISDIARICHEANKALCETQGDKTQVSFEEAPAWQRDSAIHGVQFNIDNPEAPASASHDNWLKEKEEAGWKFGPVKDAGEKEHPCMVAFDNLPEHQKAKDHLFKAICSALSPFV